MKILQNAVEKLVNPFKPSKKNELANHKLFVVYVVFCFTCTAAMFFAVIVMSIKETVTVIHTVTLIDSVTPQYSNCHCDGSILLTPNKVSYELSTGCVVDWAYVRLTTTPSTCQEELQRQVFYYTILAVWNESSTSSTLVNFGKNGFWIQLKCPNTLNYSSYVGVKAEVNWYVQYDEASNSYSYVRIANNQGTKLLDNDGLELFYHRNTKISEWTAFFCNKTIYEPQIAGNNFISCSCKEPKYNLWTTLLMAATYSNTCLTILLVGVGLFGLAKDQSAGYKVTSDTGNGESNSDQIKMQPLLQ
eukprot:TRINITY_DN80533_c0_g1_i1.p1 TRINITY_DN80533_c0_g1~~TRINITY_DN80533_c0_g1_i1.p1  ORF type:complete len:303 (+),score=42.89 TRINITY_DN80533_c0_g1_i1:173-1081(+)